MTTILSRERKIVLVGGSLIFLMLGCSASLDAVAQSTSFAEGVRTSELAMKNAEGDAIDSASVGQLVVLSTRLWSTMNSDQSYALILEARDDTGVTQFLEFSVGNIDSNDQFEIGISWTPEQAGEYQLRTFAITGFQAPAILSGVETIDIEIG